MYIIIEWSAAPKEAGWIGQVVRLPCTVLVWADELAINGACVDLDDIMAGDQTLLDVSTINKCTVRRGYVGVSIVKIFEMGFLRKGETGSAGG